MQTIVKPIKIRIPDKWKGETYWQYWEDTRSFSTPIFQTCLFPNPKIYNEKNRQRFFKNVTTHLIDDLNHDIMHKVLHEVINYRAMALWDNIDKKDNEYIITKWMRNK